MNVHFSRVLEDTNTADEDSASATSYVPSLEGYLSLELSLYLPDLSSDVVTLSQENVKEVEERLDSLLLLFMCSRDIDLIISPSPDSLMSVCPFQDSNENNTEEEEEDNDEDKGKGDRMRRKLVSFLEDMGQQFRRVLQTDEDGLYTIDDPTGMVLWNIPKVDSEVKLLGTRATSSTSRASDQEDILLDANEYYTLWKFTYPVYNWGQYDIDSTLNEDVNSVQTQLDDSIVDGTFDAVLPWETAESSVIGQELRTFANASFVAPDDAYYTDDAYINGDFYDNEIPHEKAVLLQSIGGLLLIFNTIFVVVLSILAKKHRVRKEAKAKEMAENQATGLDTEEGVIEMLMESKAFAMTTSQEFRTQRRSRNSADMASSTTLNASNLQKDHSHHKEKSLVDKAKRQQTQEFSDRLLANLSMEEDEDDHVDFRPPSPFRNKTKIPRYSSSSPRRKSHRKNMGDEEC
ncbi:MAG: hypothetical protein SGILL_006731 [Bacillariaceae sp.]